MVERQVIGWAVYGEDVRLLTYIAGHPPDTMKKIDILCYDS